MRKAHIETSVSVPGVSASRKTALLSSAGRHRLVLAAAAAALLPAAPAFAQCSVAPAPVSISTGDCVDPAFTARQSAGAAPVVQVSGDGTYTGEIIDFIALGSGYGVHATGGGTITLIGTELDGAAYISTYGDGGHGLYADGGGTIIGSYTSVYTNGTGAYGAGAVGTGSVIELTDSRLETALADAHGAYAADGGTITLTRTEVMTYGVAASAVFAEAGSAITLNDVNTFGYGDNAPGAVASGAGSSLTLNDSYVNVYGSGGAGLLAIDAGAITMSGGAIASGDYYGGTINADAPGMLARGVGSSILADNGASVATYGANSPGVWADAGGRIDFAGYGIFTYQPNSPGALATGAGSVVTLTDTIVRTSGPAGAGLSVTTGGLITVTGTEVTTGYGKNGATLPALQFPTADIGLESHGADVVGAGSRLEAQNVDITTLGDGAIGVRVSQGASASIVGSDIRTGGAGTAAVGGADGVRATDAGSSITLSGTSIRTAGDAAFGVRAGAGGSVQITGGLVETTGSAAHGLAAIDGGSVTVSGAAVAADGAGSSAIYLAGAAPSAVSITGGSLSAADGAIVRAEGGTGVVSIGGGAVITPALVNGRRLLAQVDGASDLALNITGLPSLTGDVVVEASTLAYSLSNSRWTGDLLADPASTADVSLAQGSLWTGLARNATDIAIDAGSAWNVTGDSNATGLMTNAGLIQFVARPSAYSTLTVGGYTGAPGSRVGFNTYLGADASPTNLLVINGGVANGATTVLVDNTGGPGAQTTGDGIRLVQVTGGGTSTAGAFTLGERVVAGAYEYQLVRGGVSGANDWFLRSHYRPQVALYAPIPAIARQMGQATLGTLHERVGDEENLRGLAEPRAYANGAWGRLFGGRVDSRWNGTAGARAEGDLAGFQTGVDLFRRTTDGGHRDHAGLYVAYTDDDRSLRGLAGGTQAVAVGRLLTDGPSVGVYWTHFGPTGWYLDGVLQQSWYDTQATSLDGARISTQTSGYTASLEAGYPIAVREGWLIEPQAQIVYQDLSTDRTQDTYSSVDWDEDQALTARLGARLQYSRRDSHGTLWQPYGRINLWRALSGEDGLLLGPSAAIENPFGDTSLELGGGLTVRMTEHVSAYGQASHRWTLDDDRSRQAATAATLGVRVNW